MQKDYLLKEDGSFIIDNYGSLNPFSNFLPGIAGEWGIPLWVFYVNRGQGVASFGLKGKDYSISEFFPANKAYSFNQLLGFRTFLKINKKTYYEPFRRNTDGVREEKMVIKSSSFKIKDSNKRYDIDTSVNYFTLPNTYVGGLVRAITFKNTSKKIIDLEILDGLTRIIPFGAANTFLKEMSRTLEAWMQSSIENETAIFRLIVDPKDVSQTRYIEGANFVHSFYDNKNKKVYPGLIVDPALIFDQDTSYSLPLGFLDKNFKASKEQVTCGKTPCAFSHFKLSLLPGEAKTLYSVFGASFQIELIKKITKELSKDFLDKKEKENEKIIENIKDNVFCVSASKQLDNYVKHTYLDNVLRGGYPYSFEDSSSDDADGRGIYYIFSRKHGDPERDYNYFQLLPSYFSEGEANYRDISQNRRMDLFFNPALKSKNVIYFLNFLKINGFNPLVVKGEKLFFEKSKARAILKQFNIKDQKIANLMVRGFYLGELFSLIAEDNIKVDPKEEFTKTIIVEAKREPQANHGEGYWIDHWRYNLDLIDNFLYFYPDKLKQLFVDTKFSFWDDEYRIKNRSARYHLRSQKVYQGESIEVSREKREALKSRSRFKNFLRTKSGKVYHTNLLSKLLIVILNKAATLDPDGIGIEMEAEKPGWCDSLNGLPALFGSSSTETFELKRAILLMLAAIKKLKKERVKEVPLPVEAVVFFKGLRRLLGSYFSSKHKRSDYIWWDKSNSLKEEFRHKVFFALEGNERKVGLSQIESFLSSLLTKINKGISKARDKKTNLYFTYFTYNVEEYHKNRHITPYSFKRKNLPLFLEGIMHALRVDEKKTIPQDLKRSKLFDKNLKMYKLNTSLKNESLEIGRSRIFTPGWLENESIWLHMEYKYLLELLKKGFYKEFFEDFNNCGVCFFDPKTYGRNILENSSFIVSSAHPDKNIWGKGFIARLSGATAELLNIWIYLCLGKSFISLDKKGPCIRFSPVLKGELFTTKKTTASLNGKILNIEKDTFSFKLFSHILVTYHNPKRKDTFSKDCKIKKIILTKGPDKITLKSGVIRAPYSLDIRERKITQIDLYFS